MKVKTCWTCPQSEGHPWMPRRRHKPRRRTDTKSRDLSTPLTRVCSSKRPCWRPWCQSLPRAFSKCSVQSLWLYSSGSGDLEFEINKKFKKKIIFFCFFLRFARSSLSPGSSSPSSEPSAEQGNSNQFLKMIPKKFSPFSVDSLLSHREKQENCAINDSETSKVEVKRESPGPEPMTKFLLNNNLFRTEMLRRNPDEGRTKESGQKLFRPHESRDDCQSPPLPPKRGERGRQKPKIRTVLAGGSRGQLWRWSGRQRWRLRSGGWRRRSAKEFGGEHASAAISDRFPHRLVIPEHVMVRRQL